MKVTKNSQGIALLRDSRIYTRKRRQSLAKQSESIHYRVNSDMAIIINEIFTEVRRKCNKPYASSSQINRAFWIAMHIDKKLRKRVMEAVCDFLKYDTSV